MLHCMGAMGEGAAGSGATCVLVAATAGNAPLLHHRARSVGSCSSGWRWLAARGRGWAGGCWALVQVAAGRWAYRGTCTSRSSRHNASQPGCGAAAPPNSDTLLSPPPHSPAALYTSSVANLHRPHFRPHSGPRSSGGSPHNGLQHSRWHTIGIWVLRSHRPPRSTTPPPKGQHQHRIVLPALE